MKCGGADLVDMKEWEKGNKGYTFISTVIDVFRKYAVAVPLKDTKGETVTKTFEKIIENMELLSIYGSTKVLNFTIKP